jgi:hypothetical protein
VLGGEVTDSLITLFTSPKPFTNPHIAMIQRNAIRSWQALGKSVEILLIGEEDAITENAHILGVRHISEIKKNAYGTPLISSLFQTARDQNDSPMLAYVNADILLFQDFVSTAQQVMTEVPKFLLIGQRWDLDVRSELLFSDGWQSRLHQECETRGRLHKPMGSDYFIFPRQCFEFIPDFAIGRAGWDNWMIYESRQRGWKTIDTTGSIHIIHQEHDYSHLPGGQPHYQLPETDENVRLAGGKRNIFTLADANWVIKNGNVSKKILSLRRLIREIEVFPSLSLHSQFLGQLVYTLLHPKKVYASIRNFGSKIINRKG